MASALLAALGPPTIAVAVLVAVALRSGWWK